MKSIRKKFGRQKKYASIGLFASIALMTFLYTNFINPLFSRAESHYMSAILVDDNGPVDFSSQNSGATAQLSVQKVGGASGDSQIYDARISLTNLPTNVSGKKLEIKLPAGMLWVDNASGSAELKSQLDTTKGNNGIEKIALGISPVLGYNFAGSGTNVYYISDGAVSLAVNIKVKLDSKIFITEIESAISAKLTVGSNVEEAKVKVEAPTNASTGGSFVGGDTSRYVKAGSSYRDNFDNEKNVYLGFLNGYYATQRMIKKVEIRFHVTEPSVRLQSTSSSSTIRLDDSDASNGNYVFTYTPNAIGNNLQTLPYAVIIPSSDSDLSEFAITETGKTTYWQVDGSDKEVEFINTRTIDYHILPDDEDGVTVGLNSLDPSDSRKAFDITVASKIDDKEQLTGLLGYGFVNNRSSNDSPEKEIHMTFDTDVIGVQLLRLVGVPNGTIHNVTIATKSGITKTVDVNIACNAFGLASKEVSYATFGVDKDDYIKDVRYVLGVVPAATQLRSAYNDDSQAFSYHGRRLNTNSDGIATVEIYNVADATKTTGVAKIRSRYVGDGGVIDIDFPATTVSSAGDKLSFSHSVYAHGDTIMGYNSVLYNPVIYIRSEARDAAGDFIPISNLKITNGSARGNQDITSKFGHISYEDTATARVYKLDSSGITDGSASLATQAVSNTGELSFLNLDISYDIDTSLTTPSQTHDIQDILFVQNAGNATINTWNGRSENPFGIGDTSKNILSAATTNYYQIRGWASIGVENSSKHVESGDWITWSEGANPITIGAVAGSIADMRTTLINNSGVDVPGPTVVYLPIPKEGQNWGSLSYGNHVFEFSTSLVGAITNPDSAHFTILYGRDVTPSDNGSNLNDESSKFTADTTGWTDSDWADVNCVKIIAADIPANAPGVADNYNFIYQLKVADVGTVTDGAIDTWRPVYFQQLTNSAGDVFAGWYKGSYVSIKLADGKLYGQLFVDANENGKKDADEQALKEAGWKVDLYDRSSNRLIRSTETDAEGKYSFVELTVNEDAYYINVTNKHPISESGTTYLFAPKGEASTVGAYNTDNQAEGSRTSTPAHATAFIGPVSSGKVANEAIYNIGVVVYVPTEQYSGTVTFNDQNNKYNTRPANVLITASANDGSTQNIIAPAGGNWTKDLPKYNSMGDKLSYTFSANDLGNYDKTEATNGRTFSLDYTQKTATLTVNHYKKGTTTSLADTETIPVYWGQNYETSPATVDSNYEYDSIDGAASGVISGDLAVNYYYKLKRGTVITHYYLSGTTTKIAEDRSDEYDYTEEYATYPLDVIPDEYRNYELVSDQPAGYTGIVKAPVTEVSYFYQEKDSTISSNVSISAPTSIDNKTAMVSYNISYRAVLKNYIGNVSVSLVDKLPYPIDEEQSNIDGGIYDATAQTITWTNAQAYDTYADGEEISLSHKIDLVYIGAAAKDTLVNTIEGNIALDNKTNDSADSAETKVRTPAKIIVRFIDPDGNEIRQEVEEDGFVGDEIEIRPVEIPGYRIIEDETIVSTFSEEAHIVTYRYVKLDNPTTYDNIASWFIIAGACVGGLAVALLAVRSRLLAKRV